jgi:hypothetical protein
MKRHNLSFLSTFIIFLVLAFLTKACIQSPSLETPTPEAPKPVPTESATTETPTQVETPTANIEPPISITDATETPTYIATPPTPIGDPSPTPTATTFENRGLLFLLDSSKSVHEYCGEQLHMLYEVPELFISFLATYPEDTVETIDPYRRPQMDWFVYPPADREEIRNESEQYDLFRNSMLRTPEHYQNVAWYSELETKLVSKEGFGFSAVLSATTDYIDNSPDIEHFVIVLMTDAIVNYVSMSNSAAATRERDNIREAIGVLKSLSTPQVDIIVLQLPCNVPDNGETETNRNPSRALAADKRDLWQNLWLDEKSILFIEGNSISALVEALLVDASFSQLLPEQQTNTGGWKFRSSTESIEIPTSVENWQITAQFISPEAVKHDSVQFYLTNPQGEDLRMFPAGIIYERSRIPDPNSPPLDCQTSPPWSFSVRGEQENEPKLGFLTWQTVFPLANLQLDITTSEIPDLILNKESFEINIELLDGNISNTLLNEYRNSDCYTIRLVIADEDGNKLELDKEFSALFEPVVNWEVVLRDETEFLTYGPQTLNLHAEVIRNDMPEPVAESDSVQLEAIFLPEPLLLEPLPCHEQSEPNRCKLNIPVNYLTTNYYDDAPIKIEVFATTELRQENSDELTRGFIMNACHADEFVYLTEHTYALHGPQYAVPNSNGLFQLQRRHIETSTNHLSISIPDRWLKPGCGYNELLIRWPQYPKRLT